jgi:hypothetical protein
LMLLGGSQTGYTLQIQLLLPTSGMEPPHAREMKLPNGSWLVPHSNSLFFLDRFLFFFMFLLYRFFYGHCHHRSFHYPESNQICIQRWRGRESPLATRCLCVVKPNSINYWTGWEKVSPAALYLDYS